MRRPATRQRKRGQVAALRGDQRAEAVHRGAVAQCLRRVDAVETGRVEHLARQAPASAPPHRRGRRPPAPPATRRPRPRCRPRGPAAYSCRSAARGSPARAAVPRSTIVRASSRASASVFRKAPEPTLVSSTSARGALGDLLAHHRAGDQRQRLGGAGDVAQRVDLAVGRRQLAGGEDGRAEIAKLLADMGFRQFGGEARDRLELVERPAGVPESAARGLRNRTAARHHDRDQRDGDLVADAAGGMLVDQRQRLAVAPQIA